ncbi:hypothetical protein PINS_up021088, partial [Pythium insidiosum]
FCSLGRARSNNRRQRAQNTFLGVMYNDQQVPRPIQEQPGAAAPPPPAAGLCAAVRAAVCAAVCAALRPAAVRRAARAALWRQRQRAGRHAHQAVRCRCRRCCILIPI